MNDHVPSARSSMTVAPGADSRIWSGDGAHLGAARTVFAVIATQEESTDDGGSQSGVGRLDIGEPVAVSVEFDVRDGALLTVPALPFSVNVRNTNEDGGPDLTVTWFFCHSTRTSDNTRSFDLWSEVAGPNFRVPAFAHSFSYDLGTEGHDDYRAFLSDSQTGETYGYAGPGLTHTLSQRVRWVRFMNLPADTVGSVTFFLSI